jgi:hypothetical protein
MSSEREAWVAEREPVPGSQLGDTLLYGVAAPRSDGGLPKIAKIMAHESGGVLLFLDHGDAGQYAASRGMVLRTELRVYELVTRVIREIECLENDEEEPSFAACSGMLNPGDLITDLDPLPAAPLPEKVECLIDRDDVKTCPHCTSTRMEILRISRFESQCPEDDDDPEKWGYFVSCLCCRANGGWSITPGGALMVWNMRDGKVEGLTDG